jgi:glutamyl-tRNA reductase
MAFVVCGLNHKTASIDVREKIARLVGDSRPLLTRLQNVSGVHEITILSTCNRTEIYCDTENVDRLIAEIARQIQRPPVEINDFFYVLHNQNAIHHLLRVACGLDSMMIGEPQILGQIKRAYLDACQAGTVQNHLHHVFQFVFNATKRIRTQSEIGKNPISIAYAAAQLIKQHFKTLNTLNVFIIGSGETATLVAKYLHQLGIQQFMIANRTKTHAQLLAKQYHGVALSITDIPEYLPKADIVICATACPLPFINQPLIQRTLNARHHAFMFLLDLSIPRNIETNVAELSEVQLYNIDDLHHIVGEGMEERRAAAIHAEQIVELEMEQFIDWQREARANEMITDYRNQMKVLAARELERAQKKLTTGECQQRVLTEFCERLVNKLTHLPTKGLRHVAIDERHDLIDLVQYLLNQNPENAIYETLS